MLLNRILELLHLVIIYFKEVVRVSGMDSDLRNDEGILRKVLIHNAEHRQGPVFPGKLQGLDKAVRKVPGMYIGSIMSR